MYKLLSNTVFGTGDFTIVPIRMQDRYDIMRWRNEQIYHLRQKEPLSREVQDHYFDKVVKLQFEEDQPPQVLFSYLNHDQCIGYGGLVHINWEDRNAEISFIMDTKLEEENFDRHWTIFLGLLEKASFLDLGMHKIFTYAFDIRPHLFPALEMKGYQLEARLKEHFYFEESFHDVVIHSKIKDKPVLRKVLPIDVYKTFDWVNDHRVRAYSFTRDRIKWDAHVNWFEDKLNDPECYYYILENGGLEIGSIRFDRRDAESLAELSFLIDPAFFGKGFGTLILELGVQRVFKDATDLDSITGKVQLNNKASIRIFNKLGFSEISRNKDFIEYKLNRRDVY